MRAGSGVGVESYRDLVYRLSGRFAAIHGTTAKPISHSVSYTSWLLSGLVVVVARIVESACAGSSSWGEHNHDFLAKAGLFPLTGFPKRNN